MRHVADESGRENQNTRFVFNNLFFANRAVYEITSKMYCGAAQATDDKIALAHCMLDN